jgi:hypothetical protein
MEFKQSNFKLTHIMPNENKLPKRHLVPSLLTQKFSKDYEDTVKEFKLPQQIELTEHLLKMLDIMSEYAQKEDSKIYDNYVKLENALLRKYGKAFKPFKEKQFHAYFYFQEVLVTKDVYTSEQYNNLGEAQKLSLPETEKFIHLSKNGLHFRLDSLYLQRDPEFEPQARETETTSETEADNEITKARQLLAIYYLLKAGFKVEHRVSGNVSQIAKFVHLMTGTKFTTIQNSEIYKKYLKMPNYKKDKELIKDLKFVRQYFSDLALYNAVQMIDAEIEKAKKELPKS